MSTERQEYLISSQLCTGKYLIVIKGSKVMLTGNFLKKDGVENMDEAFDFIMETSERESIPVEVVDASHCLLSRETLEKLYEHCENRIGKSLKYVFFDHVVSMEDDSSEVRKREAVITLKFGCEKNDSSMCKYRWGTNLLTSSYLNFAKKKYELMMKMRVGKAMQVGQYPFF